MKKIVLASGSPRRAKILRGLGVDFEVVKTDAPEVSHPGDPERTVRENALAKGAAAGTEGVLSADTIVWFDGRIYGKPGTLAEAREFLRELSGKVHSVFTAVAYSGKVEVVRSDVEFRRLSERDIEEYVERVRPLDRAGAYDIDESGGLIVKSYSGSYENIMGLPTEPLRRWGIVGSGPATTKKGKGEDKMDYSGAVRKMEECGQGHVLRFWGKLGKKERAALLAQIETIDPADVAYCAETLAKGVSAPDSTKGVAPKVATLKGARLAQAVAAGEKELRAGRVAALLVAGGQGSRLGYDGPKGCYSIGPVTGAPLFHFHARKILARSLRYGADIPFYVMTSRANNAATVECFEKNGYFGLKPSNVFFFTQGMWPGMTPDGKIILDAPGHVFMSPDGHGGLLAALKSSGALADMKKRGIRSVFFFQVDNPLVEIADPAFVGYHVLEKSDYSLKLCEKTDPRDKVGMPMRFGKVHRMVEYTEMTDEQNERRGRDGKLYFRYGSPAIHVFDRAFLEREASRRMPLHLAFKKIPCVDTSGKAAKPSEPNGYKFEKFIFDILPNARKAAFLAFDRREEFSPVKNAEGADSPASCRADMQAKWRRWLAESGVECDGRLPVEIDPAYALDAEELKAVGLRLSAR